MTRTRSLLPWLLSGWTLVVWVPRIRNIWTDDTLAVGGQTVRTVWALIFIVLAVGAVVSARRSLPWSTRWMQVFVVWTVGFWVVRGTQIVLADHDTSFIVVHTVLALVSISLAVAAWPRPPDRETPFVHDSPLADHG